MAYPPHFFFAPRGTRGSNGFIALFTTLVISVISLLAVLSTAFLGVGEAQVGVKQQKSSESFYVATACAEHALLQLKNDFNNLAGGVLEIGVPTCAFSILDTSPTRTIQAESTIDRMVRRVRVVVNKSRGDLLISSWQEVADF